MSRRGFTLIEILIGVIVLALGLLGLAAVFPVVVREQKLATEATLGGAAVDAARFQILGNDALRRDDPDDPAQPVGWDLVLEQLQEFRNDARRGVGFTDFESDPDVTSDPWFVPGVTDEYLPDEPPLVDLSTSQDDPDYAVLDLDPDLPGDNYRFTSRLIPPPFTVGAEPRFVWDLALRASPTNPSAIEVAMFVRPIDPNIRVPRRNRGQDADERRDRSPMTLSDVLGWPVLGFEPYPNGLERTERRVPIVVDGDGRPTLDGDVTRTDRVYSLPYVIEVDVNATNRSGADGTLLVLDPREVVTQDGVDLSEPMRFIRIVGQRLLGDDGRVYEVTGIPEGEPNGVIVSPPMRTGRFDADGQPAPRPFVRPTQIVFTPQPPVEVRVFEVRVP